MSSRRSRSGGTAMVTTFSAVVGSSRYFWPRCAPPGCDWSRHLAQVHADQRGSAHRQRHCARVRAATWPTSMDRVRRSFRGTRAAVGQLESPCWRSSAPVKPPRSWPNSSFSSKSRPKVAQLMGTNRCQRRGPRACKARAISSLPLPLSPQQQHIGLVARDLLDGRKELGHGRRPADYAQMFDARWRRSRVRCRRSPHRSIRRCTRATTTSG